VLVVNSQKGFVVIELKPSNERDRATWSALLDLAASVDGWTLIGARMVQLHAAERGITVPRTSVDADALADARDRSGTRRISRALEALDFKLDPPTAFGLGHVFRRAGVEIDVLAPDGLHTKARRLTVPPAHTVQVPGGTQALRRTELVDVRLSRRRGTLPRPDLLGAILIKTRAVDVDDVPESQRIDLALLLSLVDDAEVLATELRGQERSWLRKRSEMDAADAVCWRSLSTDARQRGLHALRVLSTARRR
jgi:hypothetical protein